MRFRVFCRVALVALLLAPWGAGVPQPFPGQGSATAQTLPVIHANHGPNAASVLGRHYVVLVSLGGFRWDYARRDGARHLLALGKEGVWAPDGIIPGYPSLTFPNHFSIVTGLYPDRHGIVANDFYDPVRRAHFSSSDPRDTADGSWYSGVPLWSLAESQGMRTACLFWPGSDAEIAGFRPTYYLRYDDKIGEVARVRQVIAWLRLPAAERPHFIAVYFSEPDREGRQFGPGAPETKAAVLKMDALIGKLKAGLDATGLPIDLVVVSDHGMAKVEGGWISLDKFADLKGFETSGLLLYGETEQDRQRVYDELKKATSEFVVYRRKNMPAELNYRSNPREGDPVIVATGPYAIRARTPPAGKPDEPPASGMHGYDPYLIPRMKASFFAAGPDILEGKTVAPFENVNLYPWIAHMLGLTPPKNDGSLNILSGTLRDNGDEPEK